MVSRLTRKYRTPVLLLVMSVIWALCQLPVVFGLGFAGLVLILSISPAVAGQLAPARQRGTVLGVMAFIYSFGAVLALVFIRPERDLARIHRG